jgi:hypothetical protein
MAAIHQQGPDVPRDAQDDAPDPFPHGNDASADDAVYVSPPLVGGAADYPGGVSAVAVTDEFAAAASDEPFSEELAGGEAEGEPGGGWTSAVLDVGRRVDTRLRHELQEHPYRSLAAAAAVGYMLHSGVTSRSGRLVLLLGGRYALRAFASSMSGDDA